MSDLDSENLLERWRKGDQSAAAEIFERYVNRLIGVARNRLSARMSKRIDPEDVVQSAYRSFFRQAATGRYEFARSGDLWRLLAAFTIKKLHSQVEHHSAKKRAIDREEADPGVGSSLYGIHPEFVSREPSPVEALAVAEELQNVMEMLAPEHRRILEMRLQEHTIEDVAATLSCSERTVRRVLNRVKAQLSKGMQDGSETK